ncbi:MAG: prephenate dehydratase domain-containing protein [Ruminococcus sp.]
MTNTAAAAEEVSARIRTRLTPPLPAGLRGEIYNLKVLAENICKNDSNVTRFIILAKETGVREQQLQDQRLLRGTP